MRIIVGAAAWYGLFVFAVVAAALVALGVVWLIQRWRAVAVVPRAADPDPTSSQHDEDPAQDLVTEGLGTDRPVPLWHWGRREDGRPFVSRAWPSWTTPLAYLPETEWQLWTSVIAESAR